MPAPDWGQGVLWSCLGLRLKAIVRVFHELQGEIDESRGPLELTFEDGRVVHLTTAPNGESVWIREGAWSDPMADPDGEVDEGWAREHGRMLRVDVSDRPDYTAAAGGPLVTAHWLANEHGSIAGVEMNFFHAVLTFVSWGDDEYVVPGGASALPPEWGMRPYPTMVMEA